MGDTARIIASLGFEEKYIVRCTLRYSSKYRIKSVLLYTSTPTDDYAQKRVEKAFEQAKKILGDYLGIDVGLKTINPYKFLDNVEEIRNQILKQASSERVIICISGGLRLITSALLAAALLIPPPAPSNIEICIEHDVEQGYAATSLKALERLKFMDRRHLLVYNILKELGDAGVSDVTKLTGLPKTTVWRILNKLADDGLIIRDGRRFRVKP